MSLIQDALKRQAQEQQNASVKNSVSPSAESRIAPTISLAKKTTINVDKPRSALILPELASEAKKKPPARLKIGLIVVAGGLFLLLVGTLAALSILKPADKAAARPLNNLAAPPAPLIEEASEADLISTDAQEFGQETIAAQQPATLESSSLLPSLSEAAASVAPAPASPEPPVLSASLTVTPPPPVRAQWPVLKLTGILSSFNAAEGAARINDQMIFVGGQIAGATLLEVHTDGVLLSYGDETKLLKMGGVLYYYPPKSR